MERYSEYKDSGVKWLGEIPGHWELRKMKYTFDERSQKGFPNEPLLAATQNHGVILKSQYENRTVEAVKSLDTLKLVEIGDFVISLRSFQGGLEYAHNRGIISPAYTILTPTHIKASYFKHLSKSDIFISLLKSSVTGIREGQNIDYNKLKESLLPIPPEEEQKAMGCYLDAATSKIDKAIAMQQKMIDLLNERKQIIIQNAVTKGLDENVEMKDSGVEWIGMIPKHWKVRRGKFLFRVVNEYSTTGQEELLTVSDRTGITPRSMKNVNMFMSESLIGYKKCQKGDICSNIMWMWHGAVGVTEYNGVISPSYGVYRQIAFSYDNKYLDYMLRLPRLVEVYGNCSTGLTESRLRLYPDDFMNLQFFVPPLEEQKCIVLQIQKQIIAIEKSIENAEKLIALLQERKQIIINEVVTGKVKVS